LVNYRNECCDCAVGGYTCTHEHERVPYFICDKCNEEVEDLYILDGEELCDTCVLESLEKVVIE